LILAPGQLVTMASSDDPFVLLMEFLQVAVKQYSRADAPGAITFVYATSLL
jgi:hypothetical protein